MRALTDEEKLEMIARCQRLVDTRGRNTAIYIRCFDPYAPSYGVRIYHTMPDPLMGNRKDVETLELRATGLGRVFLVKDRRRPELALWGDQGGQPYDTSSHLYLPVLLNLRTMMVLDDLAGV